jgi:dynein regulatory complex protein 1
MGKLKRFVEEQYKLGRTVKGRKASAAAAKGEGEAAASRAALAYWDRMKEVVSGKTVRVYKALINAMQKYNTELNDRSGLIMESQSLHQQNSELKALLHQYLNSQVNQELYIPPTQVMRFG